MDLITEECPRFRILIVGKPGTGISTLISAVFGAFLADIQRERADTVDINEGITSSHNKHLILHCFQHYDPESVEKFDILTKFIKDRSEKESLSERLHAIWLCITIPHDDGEILKVDIESIFTLNRNKVPIIVVFTKFDLFIDSLNKAGTEQGKVKLAEKKFKERYGKVFENATQYALVSISLHETLCRLVNITVQSVHTNISSLTTGLARLLFNNYKKTLRTGSHNDSLDLGKVFLAAAHGVNIPIKITASIKAVKETLACNRIRHEPSKVISKMHRAIVTIWDIQILNEFLGDTFYRQMITIVDDLSHPDVTKVSRAAGQWTMDVYQGRREQIRCLMGYVVDIILILQAAFQFSYEDRRILVTEGDVNGIIYEFICSERKESIHKAITAFVANQDLPKRDKMMDKIESLLKEPETKETDTRFAQTRPLPSLLAILRFERHEQHRINRFTLDLMGKLLDSPDYIASISALGAASDIELLLDFVLCLLRKGSLNYPLSQDANKKARRLVDTLSKKDVLPKTLFMSNVKTGLSIISLGGFTTVFKGDHYGRPVTLRVVYKSCNHEDSLRKNLGREALAWWSLSHQFILPLFGIYEENPQLYVVSPYMENGTLIQWRKRHWPGEIDIRNMMLEVAQGLEYIHSEGVVHGGLSAAKIFLDSKLHCRIADSGLTHRIGSNLSPSFLAISMNYAAPELVGMCATCCRTECHGCPGQEKRTTTQTDVYAYGCLYYAAFFGTMPFQKEDPSHIPLIVLSGNQPSRLYNPNMNDDTWNLLKQCWSRDPSKRPTMEHIVESHTPSPYSPLSVLISELREPGDSMVNQDTLCLIRQLLDLPEFDSITSQLATVSDVELLLDFIIHLLRNHALTDSGSQDANRKARRLMLKLLSTITVIPKFLFITDVKTVPHHGAIGIGGFGHVFPGEYKGQQVALKMMENRHDSTLSLRKNALVWRSLSHHFILPLLGVFEEKSALYFVSPFMEDRTIHQWRRQEPDVADIHRLILEVAEGVRYLHSEGIVHGNLRSTNVLLDSKLHVQITDFGLTRNPDSKSTFVPSYIAPELFTTCGKCGLSRCTGCSGGGASKTMEADVYAFGCFYYEIFFDTIPFGGKPDIHVLLLVTKGVRPDRLEHPRMEDNTWNLIEDCWKARLERPTMEQIVTTLTSYAQSRS